MYTRTANASRFVRQTLEPAFARMAFAELSFEASGEAEPLRVRLDRIEEERLHLQLAPSVDTTLAPIEGQEVAVELFDDGYRLSFGARVERVRTSLGPAARLRASALVLAMPEQVTRQQRRGTFRVPMVAHDDMRVDMCPAAPGRTDCCPVRGRAFRGRMVNLSAGGLCTVVHVAGLGDLHAGQHLFIEFHLPDTEETFVLLSEIRHVRRVGGDRGILVGLRFDSGLSPTAERQLQAIGQFVTREERRRLRRRR